MQRQRRERIELAEGLLRQPRGQRAPWRGVSCCLHDPLCLPGREHLHEPELPALLPDAELQQRERLRARGMGLLLRRLLPRLRHAQTRSSGARLPDRA